MIGGLFACAPTAHAQEQPALYTADFRGQPLGQAIERLVGLAGINIAYDRVLTRGKESSCAAKGLSAQRVLACILEGSGLTLDRLTSGTFVLRELDEALLPIPVSEETGSIKGHVLTGEDAEPLAGVNVVLVGTTIGAATGADGGFEIAGVRAGRYTLEATMIGFEPGRISGVEVSAERASEVTFTISESALLLSEVVVTPGVFQLLRRVPTIRQTLSREELRRMPHLADDAFRAISRLPGMAATELSAGFSVRGGSNEEVLVLMDGLELIEPFHIKNDFGGGLLSIIDTEAIGGIEMMTGAFPAEYGNRLSGVFNMTSPRPSSDRARTSVGLSFTNLRFVSEGTHARGDWLLIGRRGYVDLLLKLSGYDDDFGFTYYDTFGKVSYRLGPANTLTAHILRAVDDIRFQDVNPIDADSGTWLDRSSYAWLTLTSIAAPNLFATTMISTGRITGSRHARFISDGGGTLFASVDDERRLNFVGFKQDWILERSSRMLLKWGVDLTRSEAVFDYFSVRNNTISVENGSRIVRRDTAQVAQIPAGTSTAAYVGFRGRPIAELTFDAGLRYHRASWAGGQALNPRVSIALGIAPRTTLRAGFGVHSQDQQLHQLGVEDDEENFFPAERSVHQVLGLEYVSASGVQLRIEAYHKTLSSLRPRYINLRDGGYQNIRFPEVEEDRIRLDPSSGRARGVEVFLRQEKSSGLNWRMSYTLSKTEDHLGAVVLPAHFEGTISVEDVIGTYIPRRLDQRHAFSGDVAFVPSQRWSLSVAWQIHSGWPFTGTTKRFFANSGGGISSEFLVDDVNGARASPYRRADLRVTRTFRFSDSNLTTYIELLNLFAAKNLRRTVQHVDGGPLGDTPTRLETEDWLASVLPSFGITWNIFH